ncbi:ashwin isoform X1 [Solea solea]|uniref:ashwin isoform X1 n=1 Tax=Solea solea TaxID=90069 RepID=UPI00272A5E06|nr:ashwin isoform X1 [Solea solea]
MAGPVLKDGEGVSSPNVDLLLHPELLSQDFMQLILNQKTVTTGECRSRDRLTELYLQHVIPLPQRSLPDSRWGRRVAKSRGSVTDHRSHRSHSSNNDHTRKRPLIVFDGASHSGPIKVKKPEGTTLSVVISDRLKPPPAANASNPVRKLSGNSSSSASHRTDATNLKREADSTGAVKSPDSKKKIQHVTWP